MVFGGAEQIDVILADEGAVEEVLMIVGVQVEVGEGAEGRGGQDCQ
jgi:hypothetical protein